MLLISFSLLFVSISCSILSSKNRPLILGAQPADGLSNGSAVTYDSRSFFINGKRVLLQVGAIHYTRSTPDMWPKLFQLTKEAGLNTVETYVFWNEHESEKGVFDFSGRKNLRLFLKLAKQFDLYVVLRIGPYVCAEVNMGGIPSWLRDFHGMEFRTYNEPFMREMARFVSKIVEMMKDLFFVNGGPIILLQIENEYGSVQRDFGVDGSKYINWAVNFAVSLNAGIPWFVCVQDNVPKVINSCNGFYCDQWIAHRPFRTQPAMFTENWSGWFSAWGDVLPSRPVADLAFSVARWYAMGGIYNAYYMWHGGTNFGRSVASKLLTSYDYDAPLDEYGLKSEPKFSHLSKLHHVLKSISSILLENEPRHSKIQPFIDSQIYGPFNDSKESVAFLSNTKGDGEEVVVEFYGATYAVRKWTTLIIKGPANKQKLLFTTSDVVDNRNYPKFISTSSIKKVLSKHEPIGIWNKDSSRYNTGPLEQVTTTRDTTDYFWYSQNITNFSELNGSINVSISEVTDYVFVFLNNRMIGSGRGNMGDLHFICDMKSFDLSNGLQLSILTETLGLGNFGAHFEKWVRGINGKVLINNVDITFNGWDHQIGLFGEHEHNFISSKGYEILNEIPTKSTSMTWFQIYLPEIDVGSTNSYALDLGSMGKGQVWMNGYHLGRYWNVSSHLPGTIVSPYPYVDLKTNYSSRVPCDYAGSYSPDKCRNGIEGEATQRYYHVPRPWLNVDKENVVVLFEELGGDLTKVGLVQVTRISKETSYPEFVIQ